LHFAHLLHVHQILAEEAPKRSSVSLLLLHRLTAPLCVCPFQGRGKLRRFLIPLLLGIKLKAGILLPLFFTAVTVIALKALGAGLTALLLSSVLGLKALVDSTRTSKLSVEVRPHSTVEHQYHHSHHHVHPVDTHWTPGWGRDGDDQAYRGYYDEEVKE
jgi:hypothetical protein